MDGSVSVVTVVRNDRSGLVATARSVAKQIEVEMEYVVVDGESDDGTWQAVKDLERYITKADQSAPLGIYAAMNHAISLCTNEWVVFLNAGDFFVSPDSLHKMVELVPDGVSVVTADAIEDETGDTHRFPPRNEFWRGMVFDHQACLVRRHELAARPFDDTMQSSADLQHLIGLRAKGCTFLHKNFAAVRKPYSLGATATFESRQAERSAVLQPLAHLYPVDELLAAEQHRAHTASPR